MIGGYSEKKDKVVIFRVDRIATIPEILNADTVEKPKNFDFVEFTKETFFGWVFGFGGKVQILAPESVKEQYRQMIMQANGML